MNVITKLLIFVLAISSCSSASQPAVTSTAPETMRSASAVRDPAGFPNICDLGDYCEPCGTIEHPCPAGKSGPLCCTGDVCVIWSGSHCSGDLGWCFNYTTETHASGVEVATCHDGEDDD